MVLEELELPAVALDLGRPLVARELGPAARVVERDVDPLAAHLALGHRDLHVAVLEARAPADERGASLAELDDGVAARGEERALGEQHLDAAPGAGPELVAGSEEGVRDPLLARERGRLEPALAPVDADLLVEDVEEEPGHVARFLRLARGEVDRAPVALAGSDHLGAVDEPRSAGRVHDDPVRSDAEDLALDAVASPELELLLRLVGVSRRHEEKSDRGSPYPVPKPEHGL